MIVVLASFRLPVEAVPEARARLPEFVATTRAEAGCTAYDVAEDVLMPGRFVVSELWESRPHLDAHLAAPHMAAWAEWRTANGMSDRTLNIIETA